MKRFLLVAVIGLVLALGAFSVFQSLKAADLALQLEHKNSELVTKTSENTQLRVQLIRSNSELEQAVEDAEFVAIINSAYERDAAKVTEQNNQLSQQAADLRSSPDEDTRQWADRAMPPDAVRLLKQATGASSSNQHSLSITTS